MTAPFEPRVRRPSSGIHHVCVYAADIDASIRFYEHGLGFIRSYSWPESDVNGRRFVMNCIGLQSADGAAHIELFPAEKGAVAPGAKARGMNHFALAIVDCDAVYARAMASGGRGWVGRQNGVEWDGSPSPFVFRGEPEIRGRLAFLNGPDGETIELAQIDPD